MNQLETPSDTLSQLGVNKIVNAYGPATILGGSTLDPRITKVMGEVARSFVDMDELLDKVDSKIASILEVEAAHVTSGAAAGLALSAAACMTGSDQSKIEKLPDTADFERNEVVVQAGHRNTYDRCLRVSGARLVMAGIPLGVTRLTQEDRLGVQCQLLIASLTILAFASYQLIPVINLHNSRRMNALIDMWM